MVQLPDDPRLDLVDYECPRCPVCGSEAETLYESENGDIVGCDGCVKTVDAWEWEERERARTEAY